MLIQCPHCELEADVGMRGQASFVRNGRAMHAHCPHIRELRENAKAPPTSVLAACPHLSRAVRPVSQRLRLIDDGPC